MPYWGVDGNQIVDDCPTTPECAVPDKLQQVNFGGFYSNAKFHPNGASTLPIPSPPLPPCFPYDEIPHPPVDERCWVPGQPEGVYEVDGLPGSPFEIIPFVSKFENPEVKEVKFLECRKNEDGYKDGHCMSVYELDIGAFQARPFDETIPECTKFDATWFLGYDQMAPGPTIRVPAGQESLIRFNNVLNKDFDSIAQDFDPCLPINGGKDTQQAFISMDQHQLLLMMDGQKTHLVVLNPRIICCQITDHTLAGTTTMHFIPPQRMPTEGWLDFSSHLPRYAKEAVESLSTLKTWMNFT